MTAPGVLEHEPWPRHRVTVYLVRRYRRWHYWFNWFFARASRRHERMIMTVRTAKRLGML